MLDHPLLIYRDKIFNLLLSSAFIAESFDEKKEGILGLSFLASIENGKFLTTDQVLIFFLTYNDV